MKKTIIYLVRHGQTEHNRDGIVSGHVNTVLTEKGKQQAAATRDALAHIKFDVAYSSDLDRAIDTAAIIHETEVPEPNRLKELRERNFGEYDGLPGTHLEKLQTKNKSVLDTLSEEDVWKFSHHPTIESNHELATRFVAQLRAIAEENQGKTILVVAHGGALRTALISIGYATQRQLPSGSVDNAAYVELIYEKGKFTVDTIVGVHKK
jgi:broad specificity phosphatase PhoE